MLSTIHSSEAADMATQAFRLLDLPPELRQRIYRETLRPYKVRQKRLGRKFIHHAMDTEILRVNRQVSMEAYEVMLKSHLFIRIVTSSFEMKDVLSKHQIPVLSMDKSLVKRCKAVTLTHKIEMRNLGWWGPHRYERRYNFIILCEDLDLFCKCLAESESRIDNFGVNSGHALVLHNPFSRTSTPDYMRNATNQDRFLKPYRERLRGFTHFKITGHIDPGLAKTIEAEVCRPANIHHLALMRDIMRQNKQAKHYVAINDTDMVLETLNNVCSQIHCLGTRTVWKVLKSKHGAHFTNEITQVYFMLSFARLTFIVSVMKKMVEEQEDLESISNFGMRMVDAAKEAAYCGRTLGTGWKMNNQQKGEMALQFAIRHRLAQSRHEAKAWIRQAARRLPGNADVASERQKIAAMREHEQ
ncbi:hypothetical protein F5Y05DRAFT_337774 [Hypoxylon sp. FL0543]|nr:hypothetical protein F5Y05DRAFT_337774 [Hypoxylon sp. FL0543]